MSAPVTYPEVARQMQMVVDCAGLSAALSAGEVSKAGVLLGRAIDNYPEIEAGLLSVASSSLNLLLDQGRLTTTEAAQARRLTDSALSRVAHLMAKEGQTDD